MTREELNNDMQKEIIAEERNIKRKKYMIITFKIMLIIIISFLCFYLYTTYVSTSIISFKEYRYINNKIPNEFNGSKIIHFSDLNYGTTVFEKKLKEVVKEINLRNPDLIIFTGDLIDKNYKISSKEVELISNELCKLNSRLGKYAIFGDNDDYYFNVIMNQSDFKILNNESELIYNNSNNPILLIGNSSLLNNKYDINKAYNYFNNNDSNKNIFSISLIHEPDLVDKILNSYNTDLILAGHSHNGYFKVPFFGPIHEIDGATKYNNDTYSLDNSKLYISGGIGTDGPGFRLFNRPSINLYRLSNK